MPDNILEGVQYRTANLVHADRLPSKGFDIFDLVRGAGWTDIEAGQVSFPANTEFRMKPVKVFHLHEGATYRTFTDRASLDKAIAEKLENEQTVQVSMGETTSTKLSADNLQVFDGKTWTSTQIGGHSVRYSYAAKFRIRPDYYHEVTTIDPLIRGSVSFHDIDELTKYVDNRIRTNGLDFSVKKVRYL